MSTVKCINTGGYKLTENKEYDVLRDEGNYFILENDKGKVVRYSKEFFEDVVEEVEEVAPVRTEQDCIDSITVRNNIVHVTLFDGKEVSLNNCIDPYSRTIASCGIKDCDGLNNQIGEIDNMLSNYDDDDYLDLRKALMKKCIETSVMRSRYDAAFYLLSTTVNTIEGPYKEVLDELSVATTPIKRNPNSENDIIAWMIPRA